MTSYDEIAKSLPHSMLPISAPDRTPTLVEAVAYIDAIDFSLIEQKLQISDPLIRHRWTRQELEAGIQYYRNFLYLNKKYLTTFPILPPMLEVDEIWHHHILDSRKYFTDCRHIFGCYFHHYPYFGIRGRDDKRNLDHAFNIVQRLHKHEFGSAMRTIWT